MAYGQIIEYIPGELFLQQQFPRQRSVAAPHCYSLLPRIMDHLSMIKWAVSVASSDEVDAFAKPAQCLAPWTLLTYTDRLYLASYTTPPSADTLFPYPEQQPARRSPTKRSARAADGPSVVSERSRTIPYYFSIDDSLLYNAFHHDFGPLHIGHLYRFAVQFHDILGAPENKNKPVVFWSKADARSKCFLPFFEKINIDSVI